MPNEEVKKFFDEQVEFRKDKMDQPAERWTMQDLLDRIINKTELKKEHTVLEVGCGSGEFLQLLEHQGYKNLWGVDLSPKMIAHAKKTTSAKVSVADAAELIYEDDKFDLILAISFIQYPENPEEVFAELHRVLKPNGKLAIMAFNESGQKIKRIFKKKDKYDFYEQPHNTILICTIPELSTLLFHNNFKVTYSKPFGFVFSNCPKPLLKPNIAVSKILEKTPLSRFGRDLLIISEPAKP